MYIVGLRPVVDRKSLASESFMPCYLGQKTQDNHSQIRDDVSEKAEFFLVSSCDLPLLDGIRSPGMAHIDRKGVGLLQHLLSRRVTQELLASSGDKTVSGGSEEEENQHKNSHF